MQTGSVCSQRSVCLSLDPKRVLHTPYREQEDIIRSLRTSQAELEAENEALRSANVQFKDQSLSPGGGDDHQYQQPPDLNVSSSSTTSLHSHPSITRLVAHLDVDLTNLPPSSSASRSSVGVATATATVPIKFDSSYRAAMEKGL